MVLREFLLGLEENSCANGIVATGTGLEHREYLVTDLNTGGLGYWSLIINMWQ